MLNTLVRHVLHTTGGSNRDYRQFKQTNDPKNVYAFTDAAIDFMRDNREQPFFLYLTHHAVHSPYHARQELIDKYSNKPAAGGQSDAKLAACGIHVRRGVAVHGWAFNVSTPPDPWSLIVPCGLRRARVTSIADHGQAPGVEDVARRAAPLLCRALGREPVEARDSPLG